MALDIDNVTSFWDSRPCNVRHSKRNPFQGSDAARAYSREVTQRKYFVEPHIPGFADFDSAEGWRVLDLGCGIGTDAISFAKAGAKVTAIDISAESLKIAQVRAMAEGVRICFYRTNIEANPRVGMHKGRRRYYDLVYSFGVIHHTPDPVLALKTARYYLKPAGTLKIMLYNRKSTKVLRLLWKYWWKYRLLIFSMFKDLDEIVARESEAQMGCPITRTYTKKSATKLLESCGFTVESIEVEHIFPYSVKHYIDYEYVLASPWKYMPHWLFRWFERHFGWHLCITASVTGSPVSVPVARGMGRTSGHLPAITTAVLADNLGDGEVAL